LYAFGEFYASYNAPEANDPGYVFFRIYKRRLLQELFRDALARPPIADSRSLRVLDVGCSAATDLDFIVRWESDKFKRATHFYGVDGYEPTLQMARERFRTLGLNAEFRLADISESLPYPDGFFDIVFCSEVVEHLKQPELLLRECRRVLRDRRFLILTTDNEPTVFGRVKGAARRLVRGWRSSVVGAERGENDVAREVMIGERPLKIYGHISTATTGRWERLCRSVGFSIVRYGRYDCVRRYAGIDKPSLLALVFALNFVVSLLPARLGRHFGATTALLLQKG
jgi:SAM-dependent methyltransferase